MNLSRGYRKSKLGIDHKGHKKEHKGHKRTKGIKGFLFLFHVFGPFCDHCASLCDLCGEFPTHCYCAVHPPSTNNALPVTYAEASEARKTAAPAISCKSPQRPIGILETKSRYFAGSLSNCLFISVAKGPGQIAFTVTPLGAHSSASVRVKPKIAAFDEA